MRLLLFLILFFFLYLLVKGLIGFAVLARRREKGPQRLTGEMVKDPVCGVYIPQVGAITKSVKGETLYFCSPTCAEAYSKKSG